ncbi:hypothetical protein EPA93_24440 [Ktedonosporobacter rubrisoli]|uniref:Uncharacterized protein n=1 Tax=Ktedonosporobacter rubrisoli TaxID=2509675 RepID=A0A4P6JUH7_KTERU|nr:hypothetical protein [Ktedonosporobacter rubrisoli]QBD78960.1 hypothetical protein EPA93_24440 [Ktedonosporobacter rubrisoli]
MITVCNRGVTEYYCAVMHIRGLVAFCYARVTPGNSLVTICNRGVIGEAGQMCEGWGESTACRDSEGHLQGKALWIWLLSLAPAKPALWMPVVE